MGAKKANRSRPTMPGNLSRRTLENHGHRERSESFKLQTSQPTGEGGPAAQNKPRSDLSRGLVEKKDRQEAPMIDEKKAPGCLSANWRSAHV